MARGGGDVGVALPPEGGKLLCPCYVLAALARHAAFSSFRQLIFTFTGPAAGVAAGLVVIAIDVVPVTVTFSVPLVDGCVDVASPT